MIPEIPAQSIVLDFHAHVLPGVDHGSPDLSHSLRQLNAAKNSGVNCIVATPHFYSGQNDLSRFLKRRSKALEQLSAANETDIHILPGAEVQISSSLAQLDGLEELVVGDSNVILLELPPDRWGNDILDTIIKVQSVRRLEVVIAHIDRYPQQVADQLMALDVSFQVNAEAICSLYRRGRFLRMLQNDEIRFLGSDVHGDYTHSYQQFARAWHIFRKKKPNFMSRSLGFLKSTPSANIF